MTPHFVDDPASWFSDRNVRGSVNTFLKRDHDLEEFARQADEIDWRYHTRGRQMVASYFLGLGSAAAGEVEARRSHEHPADSVDISIPFDATAPAEHCKDDLGTVMAHVLVLVDNQETSEEVNRLWYRVLIDLLYQRDELRRRGRIL
jgi:hypothetical protein